MPTSVVSIGAQTFKGSDVQVLFKGEKPGDQVIRAQDPVTVTEETTLGALAQQASLLRFIRKEMDLSSGPPSGLSA